jgi:hypothetical protein
MFKYLKKLASRVAAELRISRMISDFQATGTYQDNNGKSWYDSTGIAQAWKQFDQDFPGIYTTGTRNYQYQFIGRDGDGG